MFKTVLKDFTVRVGEGKSRNVYTFKAGDMVVMGDDTFYTPEHIPEGHTYLEGSVAFFDDSKNTMYPMYAFLTEDELAEYIS